MGKRSDFPRRKQDAYFTPASAVLPLLPHLPDGIRYWEACAGDGALIKSIPGCVVACDTAPKGEGFLESYIRKLDAMTVTSEDLYRSKVTHIITNPPWTRQVLHPMIEHFASMRPTWLLFDADWAHTKQAIPYLDYCQKIVSVGRVSWMENGTSGKDNSAWYLFDQNGYAATEFIGRAA